MFQIKPKFGLCIIQHRSSYYINFGVYRRYSFIQGAQNVKNYYYRFKIFEVHLSIIKLLKYVQNEYLLHCFHCTWSSLEIVCIALIVLMVENMKLFCILCFVSIYMKLLANSNLLKSKCSNQIFRKSSQITQFFLKIYFMGTYFFTD